MGKQQQQQQQQKIHTQQLKAPPPGDGSNFNTTHDKAIIEDEIFDN